MFALTTATTAKLTSLTPPEPKPDAIDGSVAAFEADHPDAGDLFAAEHGGAVSDEPTEFVDSAEPADA